MKPEEIASVVAQAIREKLIAPGAPLIQDNLATQFRVSRSPVREALRILAAQGLVDMPASGSGASVRRFSGEDLVELYDLRLKLEPSIASFIVSEARARDISRLRSLAVAMDATRDIAAWTSVHYEFHTFLFELTNRPRTIEILKSLFAAVQPYSQEDVGRPSDQSQASREHFEMVDALAGGEVDELAELIMAHLQTERDRMVASSRANDVSAAPQPELA